MIYNPWHGCKKYSEGCKNCYMYRRDISVGRDPSIVTKTNSFNLPIAKNRKGEYKIKSNTLLYTCMTSDFFIDEADAWRNDIWDFMRERYDLNFMIITKRIERFAKCIPHDWGDGYDNVAICSTVESQRVCQIRLPLLNSLPIKHKYIACEPLLTDIDMSAYLNPQIKRVVVGGESGSNARVCRYEWILHIREQCINKNVPFYFKQTGAKFIKDNKLYRIERKYQSLQAHKAGIDTE